MKKNFAAKAAKKRAGGFAAKKIKCPQSGQKGGKSRQSRERKRNQYRILFIYSIPVLTSHKFRGSTENQSFFWRILILSKKKHTFAQEKLLKNRLIWKKQ